MDPGQRNFDFLGKFLIFSGNFTNKKSIFQGKFPKNFDFLQVISQKISIFQGKFPKNFGFLGNFPKKFDFLLNFPKKFRYFEAISEKINISGQIFDFLKKFQVISQKFLIFHGKFPKTFDFLGDFTEIFDFRFARKKLVIYSYFWPNYCISLQKSPLSNILPVQCVHDKIYQYFTTRPRPPRPPPAILLRPPTTPLPKIWGVTAPQTPRIDAYEKNDL